MYFINKQKSLIYSGDRQYEDRPLTESEVQLYQKGEGYSISEAGYLEDISTSEEFIASKIEGRKNKFYKNFIKTTIGCIRLKVNMSNSEVDFISVLPNYSIEVITTQKLSANRILFYQEPTFLSDEEQLITFYNTELSPNQYWSFYSEVVEAYQQLFEKG